MKQQNISTIRVGDELVWVMDPPVEEYEAVEIEAAPEGERGPLNDLFDEDRKAFFPTGIFQGSSPFSGFSGYFREKFAEGKSRAPAMSQVPWAKIAFLVLLATVLLRKDVQFSFFMESPVGNKVQRAAGPSEGASTPFVHLVLDESEVEAYLREYGPVAREEMQANGVPAGLLLGLGLLDGQAGFQSPSDNLRRLSLELRQMAGGEMAVDSGFKDWVDALEGAGYWRDPRFLNQVESFVEKYRLERFDR